MTPSSTGSTTLRNNRARNDHAPYIAMAKAFSLSGTALDQAVPKVIDVDQWMRYYALLTLFEIGDTYTLGNPHNIGFYARPSDCRTLRCLTTGTSFCERGHEPALGESESREGDRAPGLHPTPPRKPAT